MGLNLIAGLIRAAVADIVFLLERINKASGAWQVAIDSLQMCRENRKVCVRIGGTRMLFHGLASELR